MTVVAKLSGCPLVSGLLGHPVGQWSIYPLLPFTLSSSSRWWSPPRRTRSPPLQRPTRLCLLLLLRPLRPLRPPRGRLRTRPQCRTGTTTTTTITTVRLVRPLPPPGRTASRKAEVRVAPEVAEAGTRFATLSVDRSGRRENLCEFSSRSVKQQL